MNTNQLLPTSSSYKYKRKPNGLAPAHVLTEQQWSWVEEFLLSHDTQRASIAAGYSKDKDLRDNPHVQKALQQAQKFRSARTAVHADMVLRRWWMLATADANELVELRITPCRNCWGWNHKYQFRDTELEEAIQKHAEAMAKRNPDKRVEFDERGGPGYTTRREPNSECPQCDGDGEPLIVYKDTRNLSPSAKLLYNGVERGKDGQPKLVMRDRSYAETMLAKHLGLVEKREPIKEFDPSRMTTEELEAIIDSLPPQIRQQVDAVFEALPQLVVLPEEEVSEVE
jgi:phage terminase small subunit